MKLNLTKKETTSLYEGLDYLVYLVLDNKWKSKDKENIYKIFEKVRKEVKGKWVAMHKSLTK